MIDVIFDEMSIFFGKNINFFNIMKKVVREMVFLFQAEDGIRDTSVTGVQTCALPITVRHRLFLNGKGVNMVNML